MIRRRKIPTTPFPRKLLASLPLALVLAACGGGGGGNDTTSPNDPLQPYRTQLLEWSICPDDVIDDELAATPAAQAARCTLVRAPMNYDDPRLGDVEIAVMRVPALQPGQRRGALFFNPGGPGADGLSLALNLHNIFSDSNPSDALGAMQLRVLAEYDMIGFSPRGTGYSTELECASEETLRPVDYSAAGRHVPGNVDNMLLNARNQAEACLSNPLTAFINTDATVRDMDLIRELLDEDTLNYLGYSYGTWLGAWYASRFPERVGRMVLDSSMNFLESAVEADFQQPMARERWLDEVIAPYATRHANLFGLGDQPGQIRATITALLPQLQVALTAELAGNSYQRHLADKSVLQILAARDLDPLLRSMPGASADAIATAIESHPFAPHNPAIEGLVRMLAEELFEAYLELTQSAAPEAIYLDPGNATYWAVTCNDTPVSTDPGFWVQIGDQFALQYPLFGTQITEHLCPFWGGPSVTRAEPDRLGTLDLMMVQSQYDNATPYEGALAMFNALPNARGVFVPDEYQHAVYPYMDRCVDTSVTAYLLGEDAIRERTCPALPLAQDERAEAQQQDPARVGTHSGGSASSAYRDPALASERIDQFKDDIGRMVTRHLSQGAPAR